MYSINELLDLAKEKNPDLKSDRRLAIKLGVSNMQRYRKGRETPSDTTATRLAELCGLSPEVVITTCHAAKAETPETKRAWTKLYKLAVNACLCISVAWVLYLSQTAIIPAITTVSYVTGTGGMDIMSSYACMAMLIYMYHERARFML